MTIETKIYILATEKTNPLIGIETAPLALPPLDLIHTLSNEDFKSLTV